MNLLKHFQIVPANYLFLFISILSQIMDTISNLLCSLDNSAFAFIVALLTVTAFLINHIYLVS